MQLSRPIKKFLRGRWLSNIPMVVGLTGPNASGKGEAANYLRSKGYIYHSLSDILREECRNSGIDPSRENLIKLGNKLRRKEGPSILARRVTEDLREAGNNIVDSIRNPAEVSELRRIKDFVLIGLDAPVEIRFKRSMRRKRPGDAHTLREFIKGEEKENKEDVENQQLKKCLELADVVIINDSTLTELHKKIDGAIKTNKKA